MNLDLTAMPTGCHSLCPCPAARAARRELSHVTVAEYRRQRMIWPPVELAAAEVGEGAMFDVSMLHEYQWPIYRFVRKLCPATDRATIEDIVSETFFRAIRGAETFRDRPDSDPRRWLYRIARNIVVDWYRAMRLREHDDLEVVDRVRATTDAGIDSHVTAIDVRAALARLPDPQRDMLLAIYRDGYPQVDAVPGRRLAKAVGCRRHAAAARAFRAAFDPVAEQSGHEILGGRR